MTALAHPYKYPSKPRTRRHGPRDTNNRETTARGWKMNSIFDAPIALSGPFGHQRTFGASNTSLLKLSMQRRSATMKISFLLVNGVTRRS
jgi:hypothetical protein